MLQRSTYSCTVGNLNPPEQHFAADQTVEFSQYGPNVFIHGQAFLSTPQNDEAQLNFAPHVGTSNTVGACDGCAEGEAVGRVVVGACDGCAEGEAVGIAVVGACDGCAVGCAVGATV